MNLIVQERKATRQNLFQFDNLQSLTSSSHSFPFLHLFFSFSILYSYFSLQIKITFPQSCLFLHFEVLFLKPGQYRVLYCMIRIEEGFEVYNCWFNEEIRQFGSILELECMLVHIMRVGLKGSNFQG